MSFDQGKPPGRVLASKPSSAFSTYSAGSATSVATSRSGGSRLLFASELYASVCSFVLCESSTFLKFWLEDKCRETFLKHATKNDLASLRLACHDFSVRAAPALFNDLTITFRTTTFTKPARLAALDRLGFYVKTLEFRLPHTTETFLPPLVDPETGSELSFTYVPQIDAPTARRPKYGDIGTTEVLTRQWPTLFHAATNVPAFIRALSAFVNLENLSISCPGYEDAQKYRRSIVDYALISLRIAVEQNNFNALRSFSLAPIHPGGILHLSPILGYGSTPRSASRWTRIESLTIEVFNLGSHRQANGPDLQKLVQTYLRTFQCNLSTFKFRWIGLKGSLPMGEQSTRAAPLDDHPTIRASGAVNMIRPRANSLALLFPRLRQVDFENVKATATDISSFAAAHKGSIEEFSLTNTEVTEGSWDDALSPLTNLSRPRARQSEDAANIPIMLSPTLPLRMDQIEPTQEASTGRKTLRFSRWLSTKHVKTSGARTPTARKVKDGFLGWMSRRA